jgi:hypothetical protein
MLGKILIVTVASKTFLGLAKIGGSSLEIAAPVTVAA